MKRQIKVFLKSFTITLIGIFFVISIAIADTNTKQVAGYMGSGITVIKQQKYIVINVLDSNITVKKNIGISQNIKNVSYIFKDIADAYGLLNLIGL